MRPGEGATSFNKITVTVLTFLNKKVKRTCGPGYPFFKKCEKKEKNCKSNFLLVLVFVFESEGLRLLPLINKSALNNDYEVPYSIYKKLMLHAITSVEFEWARYLIYTRYKLTHFCVRGTSVSSKILIRLGSKRSKIRLSTRSLSW